MSSLFKKAVKLFRVSAETDGTQAVNTSISADIETLKVRAESKKPKHYRGTTRLNKKEVNEMWVEFKGDVEGIHDLDGSAVVKRTIERMSRKDGLYCNFVEKLTRNANGYGSISWSIEIGFVKRRNPPKNKFDPAWQAAILAKIREIVVNDAPVHASCKALGKELGVSFPTIRANLWVADKWARGISSNFLPHRSMIRPIYDLLCELGKKDMVLSSLSAYTAGTKKASKHVLDILNEERGGEG
jgi:hypothetical protein